MEKIVITTSFIKLDSLLKLCGEAETGGHAKEMIFDGEVKVDGEVCTVRGKKIYPGAVIKVNNMEYEVAGA